LTKTGSKVAYLTGALAAAVVFVLVLSRSVAVETVYPVERARLTLVRKVVTRIAGFFSGAAARAENVRLRREAAALAVLKGDVERLESENARLRRALDYADRAKGVWLPAAVLSTHGGAAGRGTTIRVDRGGLAGVRKGAVVVVPEGLVGRVVSVTPHTSEIVLLTDDTVKVACEIENGAGGRIGGVIAGGSDESLSLRHLLGTADALPRSRVLTSGLGGVFPKGIEIGTLIDIRKDAQGIAREGEVQPAVDYSALEDVFIRREQ